MIDIHNLPPIRKGDWVTLDTGERFESRGNGQIDYCPPHVPCDFFVSLWITNDSGFKGGIPISYRCFTHIHRNGVLVWSKDAPKQLSLFDAPQRVTVCEFCDVNPATVITPDGDNVCRDCYEGELA